MNIAKCECGYDANAIPTMGRWNVKCSACGRGGQTGFDADEAITAWNRDQAKVRRLERKLAKARAGRDEAREELKTLRNEMFNAMYWAARHEETAKDASHET